MKNLAAAEIDSSIVLCAKSLHKRQKEGTTTPYCKAVNHLLETHALDDVIVEINTEIMRSFQLVNKTPIDYAKLLCAKSFCGNRVHSEYVIKTNLSKDFKTPSEPIAIVHSGPGTGMQQCNTWCDTQYS